MLRSVSLSTDDPRRSSLSFCERADVQRILGISSGGDAALVAIAQLAGGDYDANGAEQVGEALALAAVRVLLRGTQVRWCASILMDLRKYTQSSAQAYPWPCASILRAVRKHTYLPSLRHPES